MALSVEVVDSYSTKFAMFSAGPLEFVLDVEPADYIEIVKACREGVDWEKDDGSGQIAIKDNEVLFVMETSMDHYMKLTLPTSECVDVFEKVCRELLQKDA